MKIKTKNNTPKVFIAVLAVILVVSAAGTFAYLKYIHPKAVSDNALSQQTQTQQSGVVNYDNSTPDQKSAGSTTKDQATSQASGNTTPASTITVTPSYTAQSNRLTVLLSVITNTGTCTLALTGPSAPAPATVNIQAQSSYSVCEGFDTSTLAAGDWTAKVDVVSGSQTGTATYKFTVKS